MKRTCTQTIIGYQLNTSKMMLLILLTAGRDFLERYLKYTTQYYGNVHFTYERGAEGGGGAG